MKRRVIARLDVKNDYLIKGVQLEGLRKLGAPNDFAIDYYRQEIDEILYMDAVASLYERNSLHEVVARTVENVFCPVCVGGGVRRLEDVRSLLRVGADKVAVNTAAVRNPELIEEVANTFGSQCFVLSVEAKRNGAIWECYIDNGREHTGRNLLDWVREAEDRGAGEILLTSVDNEGTRRGFDIEMVGAVTELVGIPVIASGGAGTPAHLTKLFDETEASGAAVAYLLHYKKCGVADLRTAAEAA